MKNNPAQGLPRGPIFDLLPFSNMQDVSRVYGVYQLNVLEVENGLRMEKWVVIGALQSGRWSGALQLL